MICSTWRAPERIWWVFRKEHFSHNVLNTRHKSHSLQKLQTYDCGQLAFGLRGAWAWIIGNESGKKKGIQSGWWFRQQFPRKAFHSRSCFHHKPKNLFWWWMGSPVIFYGWIPEPFRKNPSIPKTPKNKVTEDSAKKSKLRWDHQIFFRQRCLMTAAAYHLLWHAYGGEFSS